MNILMIDDHDLFSLGLKIALEQFAEIKEISTINQHHLDELENHLSTSPPDVLLLDIHIGDSDGFKLGQEIRGQFPDIPLVFLTGFDFLEYRLIAREIGAKGFLNKNIQHDALLQQLKKVHSGETVGLFQDRNNDSVLKDLEKELLQLLSQGLTHQQIAKKIGYSKRTVENKIQHIYAKLGVTSSNAAIVKGVEFGIIRIFP